MFFDPEFTSNYSLASASPRVLGDERGLTHKIGLGGRDIYFLLETAPRPVILGDQIEVVCTM